MHQYHQHDKGQMHLTLVSKQPTLRCMLQSHADGRDVTPDLSLVYLRRSLQCTLPACSCVQPRNGAQTADAESVVFWGPPCPHCIQSAPPCVEHPFRRTPSQIRAEAHHRRHSSVWSALRHTQPRQQHQPDDCQCSRKHRGTSKRSRSRTKIRDPAHRSAIWISYRPA